MMSLGLQALERGAVPRRSRPLRADGQDTGFGFALISDHFHPWIDRQGQSPFVWSVLGAIAQATQRLVVGTAVTCPTMRIHPAIVAQAAATTAALMPGRFFLGVGTGENLNEHIVGPGLAGDRGPPGATRGGDRGHPAALGGRQPEPSRPPLHRRERPPLHPARRAAAPLTSRRGPAQRGAGRAAGRRHDRHRSGRLALLAAFDAPAARASRATAS